MSARHRHMALTQRLIHPNAILGAALLFWWNADDYSLMTDDGAGVISSWTSRVGARAVTGATTARPTWGAKAFNGNCPGLTFDGTANVLATSTMTSIPVAGNPSTLVVVCDPGVGSATETPFSYGANGSATRRQLFKFGTVIRANDQGSTYQVTGVVDFQYPGIIIGQFEAALLSLWVNGKADGTDDGTLNTTGTVLRIGANAATAPASFFSGTIRHVMIVSGAMTERQRQQLEGWLAWDSGIKAALPNRHPYKLGRP